MPSITRRGCSAFGRKSCAMAYCPAGGSSKPNREHSSAKKACGICVRMPQPSPIFGSAPTAPRWSRFSRIFRPCCTMEWLRRSCMSAMKPTPQASRSWAGSYAALGFRESRVAHDERRRGGAGERSARGRNRVQPCFLSSFPRHEPRPILRVPPAGFVPRYHLRPAGAQKTQEAAPCGGARRPARTTAARSLLPTIAPARDARSRRMGQCYCPNRRSWQIGVVSARAPALCRGCDLWWLHFERDTADAIRNIARIGLSTEGAEHKRHAGQRPRRHGREPGEPGGPCRNRTTRPGLQKRERM